MSTYITDLTSWIYGSAGSGLVTEFKSQLGLKPSDIIPSDRTTREMYLDFLADRDVAGTQGLAGYLTFIADSQGASLVNNEHVLAEFRASLGLPDGFALPDDIDTKRAFVYFLSSPIRQVAEGIYGISDAAASSLRAFRATLPLWFSHDPIPTNDTTFDAYLTFLHGGSSPITRFMQDTIERFSGGPLTNEIIAKFRVYLGLESSESISDDEETKAAFMNFIKENLDVVHRSQAVNATSPDEEKIRNIIGTTFNVILTMLSALQKATQVQSRGLQFYSKWLTEYTNAITSTPLYGPDIENKIIANDADFGQTTLGYGGVTVRNVLQYLLNETEKTDGANYKTFSVDNPVTNGVPLMRLYKVDDGSYFFCFLDGDGQSFFSSSYLPSSSPSLTGQDRTDSITNTLLSGLTDKWKSGAFDDANMVIRLNAYQRQSDGTLKSLGTLNQTIATADLKSIWSTGPQTTINFPQVVGSTIAYNEPTMKKWASANTLISLGLPDRVTLESGISYDSIQGIIQALVMKIANNDGTLTCGSSNPAYTSKPWAWVSTADEYYCAQAVGKYAFRLIQTSETTYDFSFGLLRDGHNPDNWDDYVWTIGYDDGAAVQRSIDYYGRDCTVSIENVPVNLTGIWGPWNTDTGGGAWPETFPYPGTFSKSSLLSVRSTAASYRGEVNSQLQQYIQSNQARKTDLENSMKNVQNLISQTTQATSNQVNLLEAIMQTMKSVLMAIFQ